jgi:hypothetical protein
VKDCCLKRLHILSQSTQTEKKMVSDALMLHVQALKSQLCHGCIYFQGNSTKSAVLFKKQRHILISNRHEQTAVGNSQFSSAVEVKSAIPPNSHINQPVCVPSYKGKVREKAFNTTLTMQQFFIYVLAPSSNETFKCFQGST